MNRMFTIIPRFLKNPKEFYQSVQRNEGLKSKALSLFISTVTFLAIYGFVTGLSHSWLQALSTAVKMPLLFLITLAFTLPALYFFALALLGIQFSLVQAGVIVLSGIGVTAFLLLGLSPITLFFVLTSSDYSFFQLLAVAFVTISGLTGLYYLLRGFVWVDKAYELTMGSVGRALLGAWVIVYGFVGAQMTWRLSPLIGDPEYSFILLQPSRDNFFIDVLNAAQRTLGVTTSSSPMADFTSIFLCGGILVAIAFAFMMWLGPRQRVSTVVAPHAETLGATPPGTAGESG